MALTPVSLLHLPTQDRAVPADIHLQSFCNAAWEEAPSWVLLKMSSISSNNKPLLIQPLTAERGWLVTAEAVCCSPCCMQQRTEMGQCWGEGKSPFQLYWNWVREGFIFIIFFCLSLYKFCPGLAPAAEHCPCHHHRAGTAASCCLIPWGAPV